MISRTTTVHTPDSAMMRNCSDLRAIGRHFQLITEAASGLAEHISTANTLSQPAGALQGKNSWGSIGYRGPAPPPGHGVHHYHFKLYALDATLDVSAGLDKNAVLAAMQGHILAQSELIGTYER